MPAITFLVKTYSSTAIGLLLTASLLSLTGCGDGSAGTSSSSISGSSSTSSSSSSSSSTSSGVVSLAEQGEQLYATLACSGCHGSDGRGTNKILVENWSSQSLAIKIRDTMPLGNKDQCGESCAEAISAFIMSWQGPDSCSSTDDLLPQRLRLLTPHEYQRTINDLFGFSAYNNIASALPRTELIRGYDNNGPEIQVSQAHATQYWEVAEKVVDEARLSNVINCDGKSNEVCISELLGEFATRVFRRPLTSSEVLSYTELFNTVSPREDAIRLVLKSLLISPNFLYRFEIGEADGSGKFLLTSYEVASLLSYTFWGTMPDAQLLAAAEANKLQTTAEIMAQTERLLGHARAKSQMNYFAKQWLSSDNIRYLFKDTNVFPRFNAQVAQAMATEFELFFSDAFFNPTRDFESLFLVDYVFANKVLADYYKLPGVDTNNFEKVSAGAYRGGLLNLGGVLAVHAKMDQTSPIARGVFVRERLLCQEFPPPPANAGGVIPLNPNLSTRERFSAHTDNDGCRDCHVKIDPIGFAFERYDGAGGYRETEGNNLVVDDSGTVTGLTVMSDNDEHPFRGTQGLSGILASSESAATCLVDQFHSYIQGIANPSSCEVEAVSEHWRARGYTLYDLWLESVKSPGFIRRRSGGQL